MKNRIKTTETKNFSLIELVIIIIVAGMFTTLIAATAKKVLLDKTKICQQHLKKIGMAQVMFATENNNRMATKLYDLNTYLGFKKTDIPAVTGCPAVPPALRRKVFYGTEFGKNAYVLLRRGVWTGSGNPKEIRNDVGLYKSPDKTMQYMDYPPRPKGGTGAVFCNSKWIKKRDKTAFRHNGNVNALYIDGHVQKLAPKDIPTNGKDVFWGL